MNTHETMQASASTTPVYRLKSLLDFQQVPYDRLDECLVNLGTWLRAARIAGTATEVRDARGGPSGFNLETGELVWADDGAISASDAAGGVLPCSYASARVPQTPEEAIAFIGSHFNWQREAESLENARYDLSVHDLLSAFRWWFDSDLAATPARATPLVAGAARRTGEDDARVMAAIWDDAKAEAAMYVEAHCVDGAEHARIIMGQPRPAIKLAPASAGKDAELADVLNTTLWLYRRLPQAYGNPPFVDKAILKMAERLGLDDVPAAIKERATLLANSGTGEPT